jgi:putative ABC transport system permease protein
MMHSAKPKTHFRFWSWLIAFIGVIVPRRLRADWRQEWEAELRYRETMLAEWDKLDGRHKLDLLWRSTSAFWDALWLQPQRLEDEMFHDLRYGLRILFKHKGFTAVAVVTLALGIGSSTAIFSAVNPILFEPLPYPKSENMITIWEGRTDGGRIEGTFGTYRAFVERSRSFEALAAARKWQPTMTGAIEPERLEGQSVSASYFKVLGVAPAIGRSFLESDDRLNGPNVAIISDGLWRRRFGGDNGIVGHQVKLDDDSYTVIGVMPKTFENVIAPSVDIWSPLQFDEALPPLGEEWSHQLRILGRLSPGVSINQAGIELEQIRQDLEPIYPRVLRDYGPPERFIITTLQDEITSAARPALLAVLGAVVLLLAIACVNVTNLLLARSVQRRGEFAMRAALGARRTRLIRQLLTESLLLSFLSGALGMVVAEMGVRALVMLSPPGLPRLDAIRLDGKVFAFGIAITTLTGLIAGLMPALQTSRGDLNVALKQGSRTTADSHQFTRQALVVAEVALALVLLVSAGLLFRSLKQLFSISPGFDPSHLLTMQVQTAGQRFDVVTTHRFFTQALEAVRQIPGVTEAGLTSQLPLSGELDEYGVHFEPDQSGAQERGYSTFRYAVSPAYLEMMAIPLLRGRLLDERDVEAAPLAVVISESLAKRKFADQDPVGRRLHLGRQDVPWYTIVGVVGDVKQASLLATRAEAAYVTPAQWYFADSVLSLVVRTRDNALAYVPAVRQAIWSIDKDQPIVRVAAMDDLLAATAAERRFALILFETFGVAALLLAVVGIYGVLSGSVTDRTSEIGVRLALGAQQSDVLGLILRQGIKLTLVGVALGLLAAFELTRLLTTLLYGVTATDALTFVSVSAGLTAFALLACYVPARRAARVDPLVALRHE